MITGVPWLRTVSARSSQPSGVPILAPEHCTERLLRRSPCLMPSCRPVAPPARPGVVELLAGGDRVNKFDDGVRQVRDIERFGGGRRDAVAGQVPGDDVVSLPRSAPSWVQAPRRCPAMGRPSGAVCPESALGGKQNCLHGWFSHGWLRFASGFGVQVRRKIRKAARIRREISAACRGSWQGRAAPRAGRRRACPRGRPRAAAGGRSRPARPAGPSVLSTTACSCCSRPASSGGALSVSGRAGDGGRDPSLRSNGPDRSRFGAWRRGRPAALRRVPEVAGGAEGEASSWRRAGHSLCHAPSGRSSLKWPRQGAAAQRGRAPAGRRCG